MNTTNKTPGQIAFEAFYHDHPTEKWNDSTRWEAAAAAVLARPLAMLKQLLAATTATDFQDLYDARADARELLELMQPTVDEYAELKKAYAAGKVIQEGSHEGHWYDSTNPTWTYPAEYYRIKPFDPYATLKAAHAAGKVIQFRSKAQAAANDWSNPLDLVGPYPDWDYPVNQFRIKPWTLSRHIPGFRPLEDGEEWLEFAPWEENLLPQGYRPLLKGETPQWSDENQPSHGYGFSNHSTHLKGGHWRTTRPLPPVTPKVEDGWIPWTGGERPVDKETMVKFKLQGDPNKECGPHYAGFLQWGHAWGNFNIVAYIVIEEKQPNSLLARIDAAIVELNKIKEEITK